MKYAPTMGDAILSLYGAGCGGPANGPLEDWDFLEDSKTPPTQVQIDVKIKELQAEYDANQYQRDREPEYPSIRDQLDYIYHNSITKWKSDMIKPVKDAHPKP